MRRFRASGVTALLVCIATLTASERISSQDIEQALADYDKNEPPRLDGPTEVRVGLYMNNLILYYDTGIMRMNIYLRMAWQDDRLKKIFDSGAEDKVNLDDDMIAAVWRPDLFVRNSDSSERVDALKTEHLFRVNNTGHAWYVVRMITNVYCPALFSGGRSTECAMQFESFSYTEETLKMAFLSTAIDIDPVVRLISHTINDIEEIDCSQNYTAGKFPCLEFKIHFERDVVESTFEAGIYLVSVILVIISWLGFWLPPTEKRLFLGLFITLILTLLYTTVAEWRQFSFVDRTTHAQIWLIFCLVLTLAMVLEFTVVYLLFGTVCARLHALCGGSTDMEDMAPKRSKCGDVIDTIFGIVIFPAILVIALLVFGSTTIAFK